MYCMASVAFNFQPFYRPTVFPASLHLSGHQSHARHQDNQQGGFEKCEAQIETRGATNKVIQVKKLMFRHGLIDSWSQYLLFLLIIIQQSSSSSSRTASLSGPAPRSPRHQHHHHQHIYHHFYGHQPHHDGLESRVKLVCIYVVAS